MTPRRNDDEDTPATDDEDAPAAGRSRRSGTIVRRSELTAPFTGGGRAPLTE